MGLTAVIFAEAYHSNSDKWVVMDLSKGVIAVLKDYRAKIKLLEEKYAATKKYSDRDKLDKIVEDSFDQFDGVNHNTKPYWFTSPFLSYDEIDSSTNDLLKEYIGNNQVIYCSMEKMIKAKYQWKDYDKNFYDKLKLMKKFMEENEQYTDLRFVAYLC